MFHPLPAKGRWISHSSVPLRASGILWPPVAQPHPASVLHIAGYVALCELFLGIEAHFELWSNLFCLVPRNHEGRYLKWRCWILGSGRPLRFEHWGARGDFAFYLPAPLRLAKI